MAVLREDFLMKDYELKARYLTDHFSRMWVRFNFFLTIESGLVGLSFHKDYSGHVLALSYLGGFLALVWFHFGRTDNFLADFYRTQIGIAFDRLHDLKDNGLENKDTWTEENEKLPKLLFVSSRVPDNEVIDQKFLSGHLRGFSATELAAFLPLVYLAIWIIRFVSHYFSWPK